MHRALQSWSPRARPLNYDALAENAGCQTLYGGNIVLSSLPFDRICVFEHDGTSLIYNQSDLVSYSTGPASLTSTALPWLEPWAAWMSSFGPRFGKFASIVPPANGSGEAFGYGYKSNKIALSFTSQGHVAIALAKRPGLMELFWYYDAPEIKELITVLAHDDETVNLSASFENGGDPLYQFLLYAIVDGPQLNIFDDAALTNLVDTATLFPDPVDASKRFVVINYSGLQIRVENIPLPAVSFLVIRNYVVAGPNSIRNLQFAADSFVLQNSGLFERGEDASAAGLVCYYVKNSDPFKLFARFEQDPAGEFNVEYVINVLPVALADLLHSEVIGNRQVIYARDVDVRDVSLRSPEYTLYFRKDKNTLAVSVTGGGYAAPLVVSEAIPREKCRLTPSVYQGRYDSVAVVATDADLTDDKSTLDISIFAGEYL